MLITRASIHSTFSWVQNTILLLLDNATSHYEQMVLAQQSGQFGLNQYDHVLVNLYTPCRKKIFGEFFLKFDFLAIFEKNLIFFLILAS